MFPFCREMKVYLCVCVSAREGAYFEPVLGVNLKWFEDLLLIYKFHEKKHRIDANHRRRWLCAEAISMRLIHRSA